MSFIDEDDDDYYASAAAPQLQHSLESYYENATAVNCIGDDRGNVSCSRSVTVFEGRVYFNNAPFDNAFNDYVEKELKKRGFHDVRTSVTHSYRAVHGPTVAKELDIEVRVGAARRLFPFAFKIVFINKEMPNAPVGNMIDTIERTIRATPQNVQQPPSYSQIFGPTKTPAPAYAPRFPPRQQLVTPPIPRPVYTPPPTVYQRRLMRQNENGSPTK